ncbi:MAG: glycosyl hydrolase [Acidimicrobiales bacterium]
MTASVAVVGAVAYVTTAGSTPTPSLRSADAGPPSGAPVTTAAPTTSPAAATTTSAPARKPATAAGSGPVKAQGIPLGDYGGEADPAGIAAFAAATGTHPVFATDYLDKTDGWSAMDAAANVAAWSHTPYRLVLGVSILPGTGTLAQGATGAYDQYFTVLGRTLVTDDEANAILRLGWEFNGTWFPWSVGTAAQAADFAAYWRQIVTTMRAVPGEKFQFLWNPNGPSPTSYTTSQAYPGDAYVDYVGTDDYDNYWGNGAFTPTVAWANQLDQQWGLDWLAGFAAEHHKPIAIPEWSDEYRPDGHGLGDDPSFIDNMAAWFVTNKVAFADVWCYDSSATYRNNLLDGTFPKALAEFKLDFG